MFTEYNPTVRAAEIGRDHGLNAASWVFHADTSTDTYRRVLQGIEGGDPQVMDAYREPSLFGELADDYTMADLMADVDARDYSPDYQEYIALSYEEAASAAFWGKVERIACEHLTSSRIARLQSAGFQVSYVNREDAEDGSLPPYGHYLNNGPGDGREPYVNLSKVASGEDIYRQTTTVDRSNYRRLQEDYPGAWTVVGYVNTEALGAFASNLDDDLTDILVGLATECPVYDEDDLSALEDSEISEQWSDYAADGFGRELPEDVQDAWDDLDDDAKRDLFYEACSEAGYCPEHNGLEVLWSCAFERTSSIVADRLR